MSAMKLRVMEKCGMKFKGKGQQEVKIKGVYQDAFREVSGMEAKVECPKPN
jgi:hypothetical protein